MSLHLWQAVRDADVRSDPLFDVDPTIVESTPPSLQRVLLAAAVLWCRTLTWPTVREISTTAALEALRRRVTHRVRRLASIDPALARLPLMVGLVGDDERLVIESTLAYATMRLEESQYAPEVA